MKEYISYKNRGMLLEELINKTINFYNQEQIGYFAKNHLNVKFQKENCKNFSNAFIKNKSTVDYYGIYQGKYITFEAKSTEKNYLSFNNIKKHQHDHLQLIKKLGGIAFYLIFFKNHSLLYRVDVDQMDLSNKKRNISIQDLEKVAVKLDVIFPGIIDFLDSI